MGACSSATREQSIIDAKPLRPATRESITHLVYTSTLTASTDAEAERIIAHIIACALKNNPRHKISGVLYYEHTTKAIVQVLEGPQHAIVGLYAKISVDPRHAQCRILKQKRVSRRTCTDGFGMSLARTEPTRLAKYQRTGVVPLSPRESMFSSSTHLMRLQYSSILLATGADDGRRAISEILTHAAAFNATNRIGGLLCFNPTTLEVTQILEGPAGPVLELFDRICIE